MKTIKVFVLMIAFLMLISISAVVGETVGASLTIETLYVGETLDVDGLEVTLENVGNAGSIVISVDGELKTLAPGIYETYGDISIQNVGAGFNDDIKLRNADLAFSSDKHLNIEKIEEKESEAQEEPEKYQDNNKEEVENPEQEELNYSNPEPVKEHESQEMIEELEKEMPEQEEIINPINEEDACSQGCLYSDACLPIGTRVDGLYCDITKEAKAQKKAEEQCENNYECTTNICAASKCVSQGIWDRLVSFLTKLFN